MLSPSRFQRLWTELGARGDSGPVFERLAAAYDEPHRAYHGARHIEACLSLLDDPAVAALADRRAEVEAALWFHDAVYDTHASDNEEQSARMVETALSDAGVGPEVVARIAVYVRATKDHVTSTRDGVLVVDVDLSILGESEEIFARFEDEIRREYGWVEASLYVKGRSAVLQRFVERPSIHRNELFRERYEAKARANIAASLRALAGTSA